MCVCACVCLCVHVCVCVFVYALAHIGLCTYTRGMTEGVFLYRKARPLQSEAPAGDGLIKRNGLININESKSTYINIMMLSDTSHSDQC